MFCACHPSTRPDGLARDVAPRYAPRRATGNPAARISGPVALRPPLSKEFALIGGAHFRAPYEYAQSREKKQITGDALDWLFIILGLRVAANSLASFMKLPLEA